MNLAEQDGLGGIGFWRLGEEDQSLWNEPLLTGTW
jgi:spore germination protein YaaH